MALSKQAAKCIAAIQWFEAGTEFAIYRRFLFIYMVINFKRRLFASKFRQMVL